MPTPTADIAAEWLAAADPDPARVYRWWDATQIALLSVGRQWDVVKAGDIRDHHALDSAAIGGPVMCDPDGGHCYILVPVGTSATWNLSGTECLGDGCWLKVPTPSRISPPGPHWLQPPDGTGELVDPEQLRERLRKVGP